jgi:hypothetical protein
MRWWWLIPTLVACAGSDGGSVPRDTDLDDTAVDTDVPVIPQWADVTIETSTTLTDVTTDGSGAIVVGEDGSAWRVLQGAPDRLDTGVTADLTGLWAAPGGDPLFAVGYAGSVLRFEEGAFVRKDDPALGTTNFEDLDGSADDLTAVSITGAFRYDGTAWSFESNVFNRSLRAVHVDDRGVAWAVGDNGTIARRSEGDWEQLPAPSGADLRDVDGDGDQVWIVGNRGTVLRWDGAAFVNVDTDTNVNLSGVWVAPSGRVYVVGSNGTALRWDPELEVEDPDPDDTDVPGPGGFEELATDSPANLYAVFGTDEENVWAVGNRGAVFRYTGPRTGDEEG